MTGRIYFFTAIILLGLCGGCSFGRYSYINHLPHDPAFEKGGEAMAAASYGLSGNDLQVSVSPVKYIGLTGGYFVDLFAGQGYNYGALLYTPLFKKRFFISFHCEEAWGELNKNVHASFKSVNLRPSVYGHFEKNGLYYKTGITAQLTTAYYKRIFATEVNTPVFPWRIPRFSNTVLTDAHNIEFKGYGLYWFMDVSDRKSGFSGAIYLGTMPSRNNFRQLTPNPVYDAKYRFNQSIFYTVSVRYRLNFY